MTERSVHHQRRPPDVEEALSSMLWTPYERTPTDSSSEDDDVRLNSKLSKSQSNYDYHSMSALVPLSNSYFDANDLLLQPATSATAPALSTSTAALRPTPFVPFSSLIFDNPAIGNSCTNSLTDTSTTSTHFQKNNLSASNYRISYPYYGPIPSLNKFWSSASTIKEPPSYESLYSRSTTHTADSLKPVLNSLKSTVTTVSESQRQQFVCDKAERSQSERATPSRLVHSFTDNFISENSVPESQFSDLNFTSTNIETNKFAGLANTNGIATIFCDVAKEQSNNLSENLAESMNETNIRSQQNKENNNCIMNAIYCSNNNSSNNNNSSDKNNHLIQHQQKHFANNQQNEEARDTINQVNQPVSSTAPLISRIKSSHKERKTHSTTQTTNSNCALFTNDSATSYSDNRLLCFPSVEVHVDGHNSTTISLSSSFNGSVCSTSSCSSRESYSNCENSNVFGYSAPIATNRSFDSGIVLHPNKCLAELERLYAEFRASESVIERKINELSLSEEKDKMRLNIPATVAVAEAKQTATTSSVFLTDTNSVTTNNGNCNSNSLSANNNNSCSNVAITTTNPCQRQSSLTIQVNNNLSNTHKNVENLSATSVQDRNFDHLINQSILNNNGISVVNCNYTQNTIASNNNSNGNNNNNNNNNNNFESVSHSGVNVGIGVGIGLGNSVAIISNPATNVNVNSCSNSVSNDVSNNSNNNCSSVPSNVFLSNVQSGSDYLNNNNNNNNNVIVNNNNNKNQNNINKNAIIAKESVNIININNPVEAQTAVAAIATSVTSTSAATSQSPTISTRLPSTPSSPSRTFTSTECQTDDISSVQLRATERAAQPTTTSRGAVLDAISELYSKLSLEMTSSTEIDNEVEDKSVMKMQLKNGQNIPMIGLGTWRSMPDVVSQAIKDAIDLGYRHIDCAYSYNNESEIGLAIRDKIDEGVIKREDLFVTSKLWNTYHRPDMVRVACEISLKRLKLKYLDCYLMHWPMAFVESNDIFPMDENQKVLFADYSFVSTWKAMEELVDEGLCRTIGVSNFNKRQLEELLKTARLPPTILQVECHPYLNQKRLIEFARAHHITVVSYSPLGSAHTPYEKPGQYKLIENPTILKIAEKYKRSPGQILLRYQIDRGNAVIPRSVTKAHMKDNLDIGDFKLTKEDLLEMDQLDINGRIMDLKLATGHPDHPFENDEF